MEVLKLSEIAEACGGVYNFDTEVTSVVIDTRKIEKGCLFICIKGERFDAHQFIDEAFEKGAAAVMVSESVNISKPFVKVDDTAKQMLALAGYYRNKFDIPVIALTGSVGKTTTKEFTHLVVNSKYNSIKTEGNLNNEIGLPQMLFKIDSQTEAAVIEMGMNHFGEIHRLAQVTQPTLGIITNIGVSHIENLGSREGILKAKLELLDGLKKGAPLLLNADNDLLADVKSKEYKIYFYAINNKADFTAADIKEKLNSTSFTVKYFGKEESITIPTVGLHNVYNALVAFATGILLGIDSKAAAAALAEYAPSGMRQKVVSVGGITSIEDCYNASPDSMRAGLSTLAGIKANKKIAVLSDMLELGAYSADAHYAVGRMAAENKIDYVLCVGNDAVHIVNGAKENGLKNAYLFEDKGKLADKLFEISNKGDAVLFKASRGMKLEDVISEIYKRWE